MRIRDGVAVLAAAGVLVLTGCLLGSGTEQRQPTADPSDPVQDAVTQRWYAPAFDGGGEGAVLTGEDTSTTNQPAGTRADDTLEF